MATTIPTLAELLAQSAATPEFHAAALEFESTRKPNAHIGYGPGNPPVKVLRAIMGFLEAFPTEPVDRVVVSGASGCSDYRGDIVVTSGDRRFRFVWDCAWRAKEQGWDTFYGEPDQQRAAQAFGYRCFESFVEVRN